MTDDARTPAGDEPIQQIYPLSVNQVVAFNLMRARRRKGWTQDETADRLAAAMNRKWTNATLSAAERSWQTGRTREFNADELFAFATIFDVPIPYFFLPPDTPDMEDRPISFAKAAEPEDVSVREPIAMNGLSVLTVSLATRQSPVLPPSEFYELAEAAFRRSGLSWSPARVDWYRPEEHYEEPWDEDEQAATAATALTAPASQQAVEEMTQLLREVKELLEARRDQDIQSYAGGAYSASTISNDRPYSSEPYGVSMHGDENTYGFASQPYGSGPCSTDVDNSLLLPRPKSLHKATRSGELDLDQMPVSTEVSAEAELRNGYITAFATISDLLSVRQTEKLYRLFSRPLSAREKGDDRAIQRRIAVFLDENKIFQRLGISTDGATSTDTKMGADLIDAVMYHREMMRRAQENTNAETRKS